MARFIQPQQQQIIPMYIPKNIDFYSGILNKAQSDLEKSTAIKAQALEKLGDLTFYSKEDREAVLGKAQNLLKNTLDSDFVSPSRVASAVMEANQEVLPGVQALKAKSKAAEMYENIKLKYGPNAWMGTDPTTKSIIDPRTGKYADPSTFKATGIDASEVDKAFLASQQQELNYSYDEPVKSDLPGYLKINKYTGLADQKREELYRPGTASAIAIAKSQLATMPQLKEVFGSEEAALARLMERNYQTSGNYKQNIDSQYLTDRNYIDANTRARLGGNGGKNFPLFKPIAGDVKTTDVINDLVKTFIPDNKLNVSSNDFKFDKKTGKVITDVQTSSGTTYDKEKGEKLESAFAGVIGRGKERRIVINKTITEMRKALRDSGVSIIQDPKSNKMRPRTDEEVFNFYNQAAVNSANVFGRNFQINPGLGIIGANAFFQPDGKRKDFRNMNIEIDRGDGNGWKPVEETSGFAKELGFNITTGKDANEFNTVLKTLGDGVYDFMGGYAKVRTAATDKDGKEISIRYDVTPNVASYKRPVVELYNVFTKPIPMVKDKDGNMRGKVIAVGSDYETGKPVYVEVASYFTTDSEGNPIIQPRVLGISQDTEAGIEYSKAFAKDGYVGLLGIVNTNTDDALIEEQDVYINKAVNLKEISNE